MHVVVVVLGDVGRSPRMQYHCQSLLDCGHNVTLVGCTGEDLIPTLADEAQKDASRSRLRVVRFKVLDLSALRLFGPLYFALRTIALSFSLLSSLMVEIPNSNYVDFVLVQNPPALPLLLIALCYCQLRAFRQRRRPGMIIDWHNLGFSMLPKGSVTRRLAEAYERFWAPMADGHLTVTKAMEDFLKKDMKIIKNVDVLYDQPPLFFQALDANKQHEILTKLSSVLFQTCPASWIGSLGPNQTLFTEIVDGQARHRPGRPALVY